MGVQVPSEPLTRKEQYLAKAAGQAVEIPAEPITREEAYLDAIAKGGGGGGTGDYDDLENRPKVNNVTLTGNQSASDLGLASEEDLAGKQDVLTKGQYVDITNKVISVQRDIARDVDAIIATSFDFPNCTVTKTIDEEVVDTVTFSIFDDIPSSVMDVYSVSYNPQAMVLTFTNTLASKEHAVGYTFQVASYSSGVIDTQTFVETVDADKKLIIQSELDAAINAIKDGQSIDSFADVETALAGKQGTLTFDDTPTDGSNNPVKSNGIYDALATKANTDMVAADFNAESSYTAGNYCIYNGKFYRFKNNHTGAWVAADVDEIKIAGELASLKSGLTNIGNDTDLGNVQGSDTITLSDAVTNYRFVMILIGYYASGYPCFGQALLPVSTLMITADDIPLTVAFTDISAVTSGLVNISFLSATSVKVVNTSSTVYTKVIGIA